MKDEEIDAIFNAMPDGVNGFCKTWGYRHFARLIIDSCEAEHKKRVIDKLAQFVTDRPNASAVAALYAVSPHAPITEEDIEWAQRFEEF